MHEKSPPNGGLFLSAARAGTRPVHNATVYFLAPAPAPTQPAAPAPVPPAAAPAAPLTLPDTPGTAPIPGTPLVAPPWFGTTFMPCVLPVFCEAEVDWLVVAPEFIRVRLLSPWTVAPDCTPVAACGFTYCSGLVCE